MKPINILKMRQQADGELEATVFADFENDVYEIEGVSKVLADVFESNASYYEGTFNPANVVGGVGLRVTSSSAGPVTLTSAPVLTAAAMAAALPDVGDGFTAVMSFSLDHTTSGNVAAAVEISKEDGSTCWDAFFGRSDSGSFSFLFDNDAIFDAVTLGSEGDHTAAFTLCDNRLAASIDGGGVVTTAAPQTNTLADVVGVYVRCTIFTGSSGPVTAIIKSVAFYPTQPDVSLPGMSA